MKRFWCIGVFLFLFIFHPHGNTLPTAYAHWASLIAAKAQVEGAISERFEALDELFEDDPVAIQSQADALAAQEAKNDPPPVEPIDWFAQYEAMYIDQIDPPEENGMRDILGALGPVGMEQVSLAQTVPWEQFPTDERSRKWYHETWVPTCEKLGIEAPSARPAWLDYRPLILVLTLHGVSGDEPGHTEDAPGYQRILPDVRYPDQPTAPKLSDSAASLYAIRFWCSPWTASDSPVAAAWLTKFSPLLDLFNEAVRKPHYVSYHQRTALISVLLPEVQHTRELARSLCARAMYRIGTAEPGSEELDAAIYDLETLLLLSRKHDQYSPLFVVRLVGMAVEGIGECAIQTLLRSGKLSAKQLERVATILDSLDPPASIDRGLELDEMVCQDLAERMLFQTSDHSDEAESFLLYEYPIPSVRLFPLDQRVVRETIHDLYAQWRAILEEPDRTLQQTAKERFFQTLKMEASMDPPHQLEQATPYLVLEQAAPYLVQELLSATLSRTKRSEIVAKILFCKFAVPIDASLLAIARCEDSRNLLRIGVALERYRLRLPKSSESEPSSEYPQTLEELVDAGLLDSIPVDAYHGNAFVYAPEPFEPPKPNPRPESEQDEENPSQDEMEESMAQRAEENRWGWIAPRDVPTDLPIPYAIFVNLRESPYLLYSLGPNGEDETARWNHAVIDDDLSDTWAQQSDDLRL